MFHRFNQRRAGKIWGHVYGSQRGRGLCAAWSKSSVVPDVVDSKSEKRKVDTSVAEAKKKISDVMISARSERNRVKKSAKSDKVTFKKEPRVNRAKSVTSSKRKINQNHQEEDSNKRKHQKHQEKELANKRKRDRSLQMGQCSAFDSQASADSVDNDRSSKKDLEIKVKTEKKAMLAKDVKDSESEGTFSDESENDDDDDENCSSSDCDESNECSGSNE